MSDENIFTDGYALLIGVGHYKDETLSVSATAKDAEDVGCILVDPNLCAYPKSHLEVLTNENATKLNILAKLDTLKDQIQGKTNTTVIIFFSGHGWQEGEYYFLPHETEASRSTGHLQIKLDTTLANKDLLDKVRQIQAQRLVVLFNTCFAGGVGTALSPEIEHTPQFAPVPLGLFDKLAQGSGRVIISSSSPEQKSWIKSGATNSLFVTYLMAGLNGQGIKTVSNTIGVLDLFTYLSETVPVDARTIGVNQTPELKAYSVTRNFPIAMLLGGKALSFHSITVPSTTTLDKVNYITAAIRKLLTEALPDQDLNDLCMDYFPTVYNQFSLGMTKQQKIQSLIEYCNRHNQFPYLLDLVKSINPEKFADYEHMLISTKQ